MNEYIKINPVGGRPVFAKESFTIVLPIIGDYATTQGTVSDPANPFGKITMQWGTYFPHSSVILGGLPSIVGEIEFVEGVDYPADSGAGPALTTLINNLTDVNAVLDAEGPSGQAIHVTAANKGSNMNSAYIRGTGDMNWVTCCGANSQLIIPFAGGIDDVPSNVLHLTHTPAVNSETVVFNQAVLKQGLLNDYTISGNLLIINPALITPSDVIDITYTY